jgi:hypothetical protein
MALFADENNVAELVTANVAMYRSIRRQLENMKTTVAKRVAEDQCASLGTYWDTIDDHLDQAIRVLTDNGPQHVCPYCNGSAVKCFQCGHRGWVTDGQLHRMQVARKNRQSETSDNE